MTLHPDCARALELLAGWEQPEELTVELARRMEARRHRELDPLPEPVSDVEMLRVPGAAGRILAVVDRPIGRRPEGVLVHLPGGGWIAGTPEYADPQARAFCNAGNCVVVSVGYRLAPEHRYPAGLNDAYAATCWVAENARVLGARNGAVVVGGDSSGGNMAAAVCLMLRDRGGPALAGQLLVYPATCRDVETESRRAFADGYYVSLDALAWYWQQYLGIERDGGASPYASPLLAPDLVGLPRAIVITAEYDILRDEGEAYAKRLRDAGVPTVSRRFDGMLHGFMALAGVVRPARDGFGWTGEQLRSAFAEHTEEVTDSEV